MGGIALAFWMVVVGDLGFRWFVQRTAPGASACRRDHVGRPRDRPGSRRCGWSPHSEGRGRAYGDDDD